MREELQEGPVTGTMTASSDRIAKHMELGRRKAACTARMNFASFGVEAWLSAGTPPCPTAALQLCH
jgi:hypothetical protein